MWNLIHNRIPGSEIILANTGASYHKDGCTLNEAALKNGLAWAQKQMDRVNVQEIPAEIPLPEEQNFVVM